MNPSDFIKWSEDTQIVTRPGLVTLNKWVNSVTVKNSGTTDLYVNNDKIVPDAWKSYGGEPRSLFVGSIELRWMIQSPAPTDIINEATVTQIFYVDRKP